MLLSKLEVASHSHRPEHTRALSSQARYGSSFWQVVGSMQARARTLPFQKLLTTLPCRYHQCDTDRDSAGSGQVYSSRFLTFHCERKGAGGCMKYRQPKVQVPCRTGQFDRVLLSNHGLCQAAKASRPSYDTVIVANEFDQGLALMFGSHAFQGIKKIVLLFLRQGL